MASHPAERTVIRFGVFEADIRTEELRKHGHRLKLPRQSFQILRTLLERPGQLVSRDELRQALWPNDTFVDFDHGLNNAVKRLRSALNDSAEEPRFIETLPRLGYRFVGEPTEATAAAAPVVPKPEVEIRRNPSSHWRFVTVAAGVLLLAASIPYLLRTRSDRRDHPLDALAVTPFATSPGAKTAPTFSPDGNEIAFAWSPGPGASADLYVKQAGSERALRLTHHEARLLVPSWSPNGLEIAFAMTGKDGNGVYVVPALGGPERLLAKITARDWYERWTLLLSWSPDGRQVAFVSNEEKPGAQERFGVHVVDVESDKEWAVPEPSPDCVSTTEPAFSPDGKYLASVCNVSLATNRIYVQPTSGGRSREVVLINRQNIAGLAWAADNRSIIYSADGSLWRVPATGGTPEHLPFAHDAQAPAVARGSNKLTYAQIEYRETIWRTGLSTPTTPAGPATEFVPSSQRQGCPRFSPDGKHVAFVSLRSGDMEVWMCDRDGSNPVQMSSLHAMSGTPRWSPDSRRIAFDSRGSGHAEIYVINVDGGSPHELATGTANASTPSWSADGRWIYFSTEDPYIIWKVPAAGGTAIRLTMGAGFYPQESLDGKRVLYSLLLEGERSQLWSVPVNGGAERSEQGMPDFIPSVAWTPAAGGIYFLENSSSHPSIEYLDFATRHLHKVSDLPALVLYNEIAVSPDNKTLLFSGVDQRESDIMLVEGFQ